MAKSIFLTTVVNGIVALPPMEELWHNLDKDGVPLGGGYSMIGPVEKDRVVVIVEAPDAVIAAMKADVKYVEVTVATEVAICSEQKLPVEKYKDLLKTPWAEGVAGERKD